LEGLGRYWIQGWRDWIDTGYKVGEIGYFIVFMVSKWFGSNKLTKMN